MCMSILSDECQTARKEHRCIWCGGAIQKGETYRRQTGNVSGDFQSNPYHEDCYSVALEDFRIGNCDFEEFSHRRGTVEVV